jgi:hypothetical protein
MCAPDMKNNIQLDTFKRAPRRSSKSKILHPTRSKSYLHKKMTRQSSISKIGIQGMRIQALNSVVTLNMDKEEKNGNKSERIDTHGSSSHNSPKKRNMINSDIEMSLFPRNIKSKLSAE